MNEQIQLVATLVALLVLLAKKKQPVFGQLTLTGSMALDWLKDGTEVVARRIQIGNPLKFTDWNVPDWAIDKGYVALIFPCDPFANPFFASQASVVAWLERSCAEWEEEGAKVSVETGIATIDFEENHPHMKFSRPKNGGKFARYQCELIEE